MSTIDISQYDKADVLRVLYDNAQPQGLGFLHYRPGNMSPDEAQQILAQTTYFDYLAGRVMKVDLSGDTLRVDLYDRDNGQGAAERALATLDG